MKILEPMGEPALGTYKEAKCFSGLKTNNGIGYRKRSSGGAECSPTSA